MGPRMLAAIRSLYSSGTLSMKVAGTAGGPRFSKWVFVKAALSAPRSLGCSLMAFTTTCTRVLQRQAFSSDLASGSLVYADDVVLLSWSASGLQLLLDSMNHFCVGLGLVISTSKT